MILLLKTKKNNNFKSLIIHKWANFWPQNFDAPKKLALSAVVANAPLKCVSA
jgi:hypothetical protein